MNAMQKLKKAAQASTKTAVNATQNLWLKLNMPTSLSVGTGGAQTMVLSVNGQAN